MVDKRITLLIIAASSLAFGTGCSKDSNLIINGVEVVDLEDAFRDESLEYERSITSLDPNFISEYDVLELVSKDCSIDLNNLEYKISAVFKNKSKKSIEDLNIDLSMYSLNENTSDSLYFDSLKRKDEINTSLTVSIASIIDEYFNGDVPSKKELNKVLSSLYKDDSDFFKYNYSYKDDSGYIVTIGHELTHSFKNVNSSANLFKVLDNSEYEPTKSTKGVYLALSDDKKEYREKSIKINDAQISIDNDLNINIKANLQNMSNYKIDNFSIMPSIYIKDLFLPAYLNMNSTDYSKKVIKPNEIFELNLLIPREHLFDKVDRKTMNNLDEFKGKTNKQILLDAIINREILFNFKVEYDINKYNVTQLETFDTFGNLLKLDINKTKILKYKN